MARPSTGSVLDAVGKRVRGSFKHGGVVPHTGTYRLHEGEKVVPKRKRGRSGKRR